MDTIRRQDAVNFMREYRYTNISSEKIISMIPSAEKTGKWIDHQLDRWVYAKCSECGSVHDVRSNYCPSCGARMIPREKCE